MNKTHDDLRAAHAASKKEITAYQQQLTAARTENAGLREYAEQLSTQIAQLNQSVKDLGTQMQQQYERFESEKQGYIAQITALKSATSQPSLSDGPPNKRKFTPEEADYVDLTEVSQLRTEVVAIQQALRELTGPALADLVKKAINDALGRPTPETTRETSREASQHDRQRGNPRDRTPAGRRNTGAKPKKSSVRLPPGLNLPPRQAQLSVAPQTSNTAPAGSPSQGTASGSRQTVAAAEE